MVQIGDLKLYTLKEASPIIGLSYESLREYVNGKIKGRKLGTKWMITERALKDYFNDDAA